MHPPTLRTTVSSLARGDRTFGSLNYPNLVMHFALVIHEFPVRACLAQHQLFSEAVKDLSDMAGSTPVEAKRELIQIALEMLGADFSLMGCAKPSLEQRGNKMDMREDLDSKLPISLGMSDPVLEPRLCQTIVAVPAVGVNPCSRLHELGDKADQAVTRRIRDDRPRKLPGSLNLL